MGRAIDQEKQIDFLSQRVLLLEKKVELLELKLEDKASKPVKKSKPKKSKPTREANLYKLKKKDQLNLLLELGLGERAMFELKYEKDRVNKILELEKKSKK